MDVRIRAVVNGRYIVANGNRLEATALQNGASMFTTEFPVILAFELASHRLNGLTEGCEPLRTDRTGDTLPLLATEVGT